MIGGHDTLGSLTLRNARLRANHPAIVFEDRVVTHGEFAARACRLANALLAMGVRRGDRVAILAQNCPEYMETYAAGELAGFITVTINFRLAPAEIAYILQDSRPRVLICEHQFGGRLPAEVASLVSRVVRFGGPDAELEDICANASAEPSAFQVSGGDTAFIIYTSGTTGRPKGVMLTHAGQVQAAHICAFESGVRPEDRFAMPMPLYHIGAKNLWLMNSTMGVTILLHRLFRPQDFFDSLHAHAATSTLLAPTMINDLLTHTPASADTLPALKRIMYSAAPMPEPLLRRAIKAFGPIFAQVYGMTESGGPGCVLHAQDHQPDGPRHEARRLTSAGQPMALTDVRIMRPDGTFALAEEKGEIVIRGPAVMAGYWNNHVATAETLVDGWLHTGDAGFADEAGFVFLVDRIKDMIVSGGENIYSREVEDAVASHPAVLECAVVGAPEPRWGEQVVAFVVLRAGAQASEADIIAHCRECIAAFKRPRIVRFVAELPKLPNGKVEKYKLRQGL